MEAAGVKTKYVCVPGMIHGFLWMTNYIPDAKTAIREAANELKRITAAKPAGSI